MGGEPGDVARAADALPDPFSWVVTRDDALPIGRPRPALDSRFADPRRRFLAPYLRLLRGEVDPRAVPELTPSTVASLLGLDVVPAVVLVPWSEDDARAALARSEAARAQAGDTRPTLRRVVGGE